MCAVARCPVREKALNAGLCVQFLKEDAPGPGMPEKSVRKQWQAAGSRTRTVSSRIRDAALRKRWMRAGRPL